MWFENIELSIQLRKTFVIFGEQTIVNPFIGNPLNFSGLMHSLESFHLRNYSVATTVSVLGSVCSEEVAAQYSKTLQYSKTMHYS